MMRFCGKNAFFDSMDRFFFNSGWFKKIFSNFGTCFFRMYAYRYNYLCEGTRMH